MKHEIGILLDCCESEETVVFDDFDAPMLAPNCFRKNLICPNCSRVVIVTHSKHHDGTFRTHQEIID